MRRCSRAWRALRARMLSQALSMCTIIVGSNTLFKVVLVGLNNQAVYLDQIEVRHTTTLARE